MTLNWPLITVLFCLSIPGILIAIKRLVFFLLPDNSEKLKKRASRFATIQTLIMVFILCFAGTVISPNTGLGTHILESLLTGKAGIHVFLPIILPAIAYSLLTFVIFAALYYGLTKNYIDEKSVYVMEQLRKALGVDGCVLYGGVVEEVIGRWGIMNLAVFFGVIFMKQATSAIIWVSIILSGLIFALGQLPAYIAAGCASSRQFIYSYTLLSLSQSLIFGYLFWKYDLVCAILSHMLFHLEWAFYEAKFMRK